MCNCTQLTIPVGPQGPIGNTGPTGPQGPSGTNAFKFVKEFETDGTTEVIPYSEITACKLIPQGCYPTGTTYNQFVDYHVQMWQYLSVKGQWALDTTLQFVIDVTTGDLSIDFNTAGVYRVVILA